MRSQRRAKKQLFNLFQFLKGIDRRWATIALLFVLLIGQSIYFEVERRKLSQIIADETIKNMAYRDKVDQLQSATSFFYEEYQDTGLATIEGLIATVEKLDGAIEVYDKNVDVYNEHYQNLLNSDQSLQHQINSLSANLDTIINYLRN